MTYAALYRWRGALMLAGVALIAGMVRMLSLSHPHALVFDEVYYARGGYSLTVLGYEGDWTGDGQAMVDGDYSGLSTEGDYVVHPMVGKLLIALGIQLFGANPVGWRIVGAVLGTVMCVLVAVLARRLLRSTLWGGVAGVLLALDGQAIVMSRVAVLDGYAAFFIVLAAWLLVLDHDAALRRLTAGAARDRERLRARTLVPAGGGGDGEATRASSPVTGDDAPARLPGMGPGLGVRWWRLAGIVALALGASVKWSTLYYAAAFLVLSVVWDLVERRRAGYAGWFWGAGLRAIPAALATVVVMPLVYVATWANWFLTDGSYGRQWAAQNPGQGVTWLPDALNSLWHLQQQWWRFHNGLTTEHTYMSNPWLWLVQQRPTAFYFEDVPEAACGAERCVSAIHALGNPLIWWLGTLALGWAIWRVVRHRDMLAATLAVGVLAGWVPWLPYAYRTIFTFYTVTIAPFMVLVLVWALRRVAQPERLDGGWSRRGTVVAAVAVALCVLVAAFFLPLWTGDPVPYEYWRLHMWMSSWV
ncbi:dolichyl-phosphate-mannose--protein mannosyltransferase [Demequina pelophila]|uniref:dolichyl-phosphate-mannose--protein mannosyltransferase n=1 Tax=Demequina pelophila TaxID=1638984 RepID=UPI000782BE65|nr:phospholipid carrier-dependent glycosyltransferase [Demequina pelophila]